MTVTMVLLLESMLQVTLVHTSAANSTDKPYKSLTFLVLRLLHVFSFVFPWHVCPSREMFATYHQLLWFPYHHQHQNFQAGNPGIVFHMLYKRFLPRHLHRIPWIYIQDTRMIVT